jgi:hypothetical protein
MANPAFVQAVTAPAGSSTASAVVKTTNVVVGDTLIALYMGYASSSVTPAAPFPAGWTLVDSDTQIGGGYTIYSATASKIATSADVATSGAPVSYTFNSSNLTSGGEGAVVVFSGASSTAVDAHAVAVVPNGTTATSPSAAATVSNDVALLFYCDAGNSGAIPSLPAGLTSAIALTDTAVGAGIRAAYADLSATGACPQYTSTFGETVDGSVIFGSMFTVLIKGAGPGGNALTGTSLQDGFSTGALTNAAAGIPLSGSATQEQDANAALSVTVPLAAASISAQGSAGSLAVAVPLMGSASASQNADGTLTISVPLSAQALQQAAATANLGIATPLAGTGVQAQAGNGDITLSVALSGVAIQQETASGTLTNAAVGQIALSGVSGADQSAAAQLSIGAPLSGASLQLVGASGALAVQVPLSGVSAQSAQGSGGLTIAVQLSAQALQQAFASGNLTNQAVVARIQLTGISLQTMQSLGTLRMFDLSKPSRPQNTFARSPSLRDFIHLGGDRAFYRAATPRVFPRSLSLRDFNHPGGDRAFYRTATPRVFPRIPNPRIFQRSSN